jgi:hypothetical protein
MLSVMVQTRFHRTSATCVVERSVKSDAFGTSVKSPRKCQKTRQQQHFRQQLAQQAPAPGRQGYQHTPLSQVRNLQLVRQLATGFYHIAAACVRVVHAFLGPKVPTGYSNI